MEKNVFITGATGFLGKNLLRRFISANQYDNYYVMVRSKEKAQALEKEFPTAPITFVYGDITLPNLGVSGEVNNINEFWHIAASTSFSEIYRKETEKINISGLHNILNFVDWAKLEKMVYVSTAYVAGKNKGTIFEDQMPDNQVFNNSYERTKYEAEQIIRNTGLPFTIYRPSVLIGNSKTGFSENENRMMYGYILGLHNSISLLPMFGSEENLREHWKNDSLPRDIDFRIRGEPTATLNFLPVDDCVEMIYQTLKHDTRGKTYNVVNPTPVTLQDMVGAFQHTFKVEGLRASPDLDYKTLSSQERRADKILSAFQPYILESDPNFDMTNMMGALNGFMPDNVTPERLKWYFKTFADKEM